MVNYNNGKIYKICSKTMEGEIYIGSTTKQYLSQRMDSHRHNYKRWKNEKNPKHIRSYDIFDKYGLENCEIILIESVNCNSKEELHRREAFYIKSMKCVNHVIPLRTEKEYREDNKEHILAIHRKRYQENVEVRDKIKDLGKVYRDANVEMFKERKKLYREINKEAIKLRKSARIICECSLDICKDKLSRHIKTPKHLKLMKEKEE